MQHPDFHFYPHNAKLSSKHAFWINTNKEFLINLSKQLSLWFNGRFPSFIFSVENDTLYVEIELGSEKKVFHPGEYTEFNNIIIYCIAYEACWLKYNKTAALEEIYNILKDHPTNNPNRHVNPGHEGYDSKARYAFLVAKEALKQT